MGRECTARFGRDDDWWIGRLEELDGAGGQGRTLDETRQSLREATGLVLDTYRDETASDAGGREAIRESLVVALP